MQGIFVIFLLCAEVFGLELNDFETTDFEEISAYGSGERDYYVPSVYQFAPSLYTSTRDSQYEVARLCGLPLFLKRELCPNKTETTQLSECEKTGALVVFVFFNLSFGILISLVNVLLPVLLVLNRKMRNRNNYIKSSLAVADMLTGLNLLCVVLPNTAWIRKRTEEEVVTFVDETENQPGTIAGSLLFTLSYQASVLNLLLLSKERFVAFTWPLKQSSFTPRMSLVQIGIVWAICILEAALPAMLQDYFSYQLQPVWLVYMPTANRVESEKSLGVHGILYLSLTLVLPYVITVTLTCFTTAKIWRKLRSQTRKNFSFPSANKSLLKNKRKGNRQKTNVNTNNNNDEEASMHEDNQEANHESELVTVYSQGSHINLEIAVLKTTIIMIAVYSLTLLPTFVVSVLFATGYYSCKSYSVPFSFAFIARICNSLANVAVYTARDEPFRDGVKDLLHLRSKRRPETRKFRI